MSIYDRVKWLVIRHPNLKNIDSRAHWSAYVDSSTVFSRYRFSPEVIALLSKWQWWQYPDSILNNLAKDLCGSTEWTCEMINSIRNKSELNSEAYLVKYVE